MNTLIPSSTLMIVGMTAAVYGVTVALVALASVLAPAQERRRDARETLKLLLRRSGRKP